MMILLPICALSLIAGLTTYITKSWISPGSFFSICWTFFLIMPITFAPDYKINQLALWFITIFSMSISTGSIVAYSRASIKNKNLNRLRLCSNIQFLFYSLIFFIIISFIGLFLLSQFVSDIYYSNNYINNWMMIPNMIAVDR